MRDFNVGDIIRLRGSNKRGKIINVWGTYVVVSYLDESNNGGTWRADSCEFVDEKQAFLRRLRALLGDFGAKISSTEILAYITAEVGGQRITFDTTEISAENMPDYEDVEG